MNKQQKQLAMTAGLVVVLIMAVAGNFKPKKKPPAANTPPAQAAPEVKAAGQPNPPAADDNLTNQQAERVKLPWGRDPFSASLNKDYRINELKLQGISFGKDKTGFAFINDEIVKKGDRIGDYEVVDVEKEKVLLRKGNQSFYLAFPGE